VTAGRCDIRARKIADCW